MSPKLSRLGLVVALTLAGGELLRAQQGGGEGNQDAAQDAQRVKPTGPAAKKADDLIRGYTARIEREVEQGRKEVDRLRAELHELIDLRHEMTAAIAELHGELASKGTYSDDPIFDARAATQDAKPAPQGQGQGMVLRRDLFYGLGSALPKDPTPEQREQLRRLAPRTDLNQMLERLRSEVDETRNEVDQLVYKLLELREGVPTWRRRFAAMGGMGGGMGGMGGGMGGMGGPWFGSMGRPMQGGGMR